MINVKIDIDDMVKDLTDIQKNQIPFAMSKTLNEIGYNLTKQGGNGGEVGRQTDRVFKKKDGSPGATRFTRTGFFYDKASKGRLYMDVFWGRDRDYMEFMVQGGTRFPKKKAIKVSTKHSKRYLDAYGNFRKTAIDRMKADKKKFFGGIPKGKTYGEGIWERYGRRTKAGGQRIRMVVAYEDKGTYKPIFPFGKFVQGFVFSRRGRVQELFERNMIAALRTAR